ncbi:hypothetical protein BDY19DRAFT_1042317 [Irpex rosettiformis]|uniref:Uncharacterized protein n=1 Tax=Irpex rosettiformis TaxID=378272 RepID=A0ACB8TZT7_9APHY|nr:hypothetical protein BDY19DRAFT_1042317 [Irpex rosettiformis]
MSVFNPRILDASIRDVTSGLSDSHKVDVLIYAMHHLHLERSKALIENAVESCLRLPKLSLDLQNKALLLRAKARLAASLHTSANQDLETILRADPDHPEAKALMGRTVERSKSTRLPGFSTEIWREIALFLPRRDLKTLLSIPHVLSRIASQLLFRQIDLHFGTLGVYVLASDRQHSQRSADILTRIITDPSFAFHVRTLRIFVPGRDIFPMTFQTGILANALPKLTNLRNLHCGMRWKDIASFLRIIESCHQRLYGLSVVPTDGTGELRFPKFKHISQFTYSANGGSPEEVYAFLLQNKASLRSVHLHNQTWRFPSEFIAVRNLTHLDFFGAFSAESQGIGEILRSGIQLESLRLWCSLECHASTQFRENLKGLPFLRHFAFILHGQCVNDTDLFPAISEFLRDRTHLHCLQLTVPNAEWAQRRLGYDATVWGVLPSLTGLKSLHATLPKDVAAAVAMWLVPRNVTTLSLHGLTSNDPISFVTQLRAGLPPGLRFIGLSSFHIEDVTSIIQHGFPKVCLARIENTYYTVKQSPNGVHIDEWPKDRMRYHSTDWLEWYGCEHAEWRNPTEFF